MQTDGTSDSYKIMPIIVYLRSLHIPFTTPTLLTFLPLLPHDIHACIGESGVG